ncbi:hypothetical protein M0812_17977 [Anaeramoeba flamelloides]|uniref:Uncharacterized protein n=1 Tax=Anaeramoeba flamelloides TaxID=1746091 RepID=A0AAV7Z4A7_9EUKA|nr:hypothetical protein M0812_17977 [Anaeramoeba flamelloides]
MSKFIRTPIPKKHTKRILQEVDQNLDTMNNLRNEFNKENLHFKIYSNETTKKESNFNTRSKIKNQKGLNKIKTENNQRIKKNKFGYNPILTNQRKINQRLRKNKLKKNELNLPRRRKISKNNLTKSNGYKNSTLTKNKMKMSHIKRRKTELNSKMEGNNKLDIKKIKCGDLKKKKSRKKIQNIKQKNKKKITRLCSFDKDHKKLNKPLLKKNNIFQIGKLRENFVVCEKNHDLLIRNWLTREKQIEKSNSIRKLALVWMINNSKK